MRKIRKNNFMYKSNIYINPISINSIKPKFREGTGLDNITSLQLFLKAQGLNIKLGNTLKGGVDSQVYEAVLNFKKVVVKHTEDRGDKLFEPPFSPVDFYVARENHNIDAKILNLLSDSSISVPKILHHFQEQSTTIMDDLREDGFELLSNIIIKGGLNINSASNIGKKLGQLCNFGQKLPEFDTVKNRYTQIFERGLELRLAYPNTQTEYLCVEKEFVNNVQGWMWPDGHPKNIFVDIKGDIRFIDFGGTYWGDQRFMLPNFLAHIVLFSLAGYLNKEDAVKYIYACVNGYRESQNIQEDIFCKYLVMEIFHRSFGKWIDGIDTPEQKLSCLSFALNMVKRNILDMNGLTSLLTS